MSSCDEQVDLACRGFRKAVQCWCRRYTRLTIDDSTSFPEDIEFLLQHLSHLVQQLHTRRQSLQRGLSVLQKQVWPLVLQRFRQASNNNQERAQLLNHFLSQCLRLHDGVLLLISGECRHSEDIRAAKKTKFPSKLNSQDKRSDGYTILYQAPGGYSGFGFDEYNDEQVGISNRLLKALAHYSKKKKGKSLDQIQDYLTEHGGQAMESLLDQHDTQMTAIHEDFKALRERVVSDLNKVIMNDASSSFASKRSSMKVSFDLHDKMEKLQVGNIVLERRADAFQVSDPKGVLPNRYTVKEWEDAMKIPKNTATKVEEQKKEGQQANKQLPNNKKQASNKDHPKGRKRRRIIEESDSEDDDNKPHKKPDSKIECTTKSQPKTTHQQTPVKGASTGLSIKITADPKPQTPGEGKSCSLASIKEQMGADSKSLETAREEVEREEAGATKAAKKEEMEDEDMANNIQQGERSVLRARRTLKRVLSRDNPDEDEIWDARETLRKTLMTVGNQFLWPSSNDNNPLATNDRQESLHKAYKYFEEAKEVVAAQEMFHRSLFCQHKSSCTPEDSRFLLRNLLLLRGQAHTNMGVTRIQMASQSKKKTSYNTVNSKRYLREAIQELTTAKDCAQALRSRALLDKQKGSPFEETAIDSLRADKLDSLASRWMAHALWCQGQRKDAFELSIYGSSFFLNYVETWKKNPSGNQSFQEAQLELGSECYYSCSALVDLASASMDELPLTGAAQRGDELLTYVKDASTKVVQVSKACQDFIQSHSSEEVTWEEFIEDNDIMTSKGIEQYCEDITDWWNRRKALAKRPIPVDPILPEKRSAPPSSRNDIIFEGPEKMPTRRFVVTDGTSRGRKNRRGKPNSMYNQQSGNMPSSFLDSSNSLINVSSDRSDETRPIKYRPWGDELLPQTVDEKTGRTIPIIPYPAVAPPMPPEVRALLFPETT